MSAAEIPVDVDVLRDADQPLAWLDNSAIAGLMAIGLRDWSTDVVLCTNGPSELPDEDRAHLAAAGIPVSEQPITGLEPHGDGASITLSGGAPLARRAIFTHRETRQRSDLAAQLGCATLEDGSIEINDFGQTSIPGVYPAGDMARRPTMPFPAAQVVHAASAGGIAAIAADRELIGNEIEAQGASGAAQ